MKKQLFFTLVLFWCALLSFGQSFNYNGINYTVTTGSTVAVGNNASFIGATANIPATFTYQFDDYTVTSIGDLAFYNCTGLTSVSIPNSVTNIGDYAFYNCTGLTSVTIPNSVTSIGQQAFIFCTGLTSVTIPNSVTNIGNDAFNSCSGLSSVAIPNSLTSIGNGLFSGCSSLTALTIPNSVTSIAISAFQNCTGLTSVTIPNSVNSIGSFAFANCTGLTSVSVSWNDLISIDSTVFSDITLGNIALNVPSGTAALYDAAPFWTDFGTIIEPVIAPTLGQTFTANGINYIVTKATLPYEVAVHTHTAYSGAANIPASVSNAGNAFSVTSIGQEAFFYYCPGLTSVTIPNSVTSIGENAFFYCTGLISVTIANSVTVINDYAFNNCTSLTSVIIPNSVTSIGNGAFANCTGLTSVTIPNSITTIDESAFYNCTSLTSVTIPNSVTSIGIYAFESCTGLTSVTVSWSTPLPNISTVFFGINLSNVALNVPSGKAALYDATAVWTNFNIVGLIVAPILGQTFTANGINYIVIKATVPYEVAVHTHTTFSGAANIPASISNAGNTFSVISIGFRAFYNCTGLTSVTIPNSVTSIGYQAFNNCTELTSVNIPNSVTSIDQQAFQSCTGLTSVTIPDSVISIGYATFANCISLTSVTFPNSVQSIGDDVFGGCTGLTSVTVSWENPLPIGSDVFNGITLANVTLNVPFGKAALYDAAPVWTNFNIIFPLTATQSQTNVSCNGGGNGTAAVVASGGNAPYTYLWSTGWTFSPNEIDLTAGTYTCTITDAVMNSITLTFTITQPVTLLDNIIATGATTFCVPQSVVLGIANPGTTDLSSTPVDLGTLGENHYQSFVPTTSGLTTEIRIYLNGDITTTITFNIFEGTGTGGALLSSQQVAINNFGSNYFTIPISPLDLTVGNVYTFQIINSSIFSLGATYGNSGLYYSDYYGANPGWHLSFETVVSPFPPSNIQWYKNGTAINGANSTSYIATISGSYNYSANNCPAVSNTITVTATPVPAAPAVNSSQVYIGIGQISNLTAIGSNLQWYDSLTSTTALATTTLLIDGTTYYVSQSDTCGESAKTAVTVHKISEATQAFCSPAIVSNLVATPIAGSIAQWFTTSSGGTALSSTDAITTGTYYVEQVAPSFLSTLTLPINSATESGLAVQQDGRIVFTDSNSGRILRLNADGSNLEILLSNPSSYFTDLAIQQDGKIIFTDYYASTIKRMNPDGTNIETVVGGLQNPTYIAIQSDGKIVFVADLGIYSVNADGTGVVLLQGGSASFGANITDIVINQNGKILYSIAGGGAIAKMNPDGTDNIIFYQDQNASFYGLSVQNDGKIVAVDTFNGGKIIRLNSDGTNLVTLASNIGGLVYGTAQESNGNILFTTFSNSINRLNKSVTSNRVPVTVSITPSSDNITPITACDSYTWNGTTYNQSGLYVGATTNCVTEKLNLTITPSTTITQANQACVSYTWPANGETYTESGTYTAVNGCQTTIMNLTINQPSTVNFTETACDSYFWSRNDATYTTSGTYTFVSGCLTSILNLTITPSTTNTTTVSAVGNYIWPVNGETLSTTLIGYEFPNGNCNTEILNLTIIPASIAITNENGVLNAVTNAPNATYQWYNCATEQNIAGQTSATFTPTQSGSYNVIIRINGILSGSAGCFNYTFLANNTFSGIAGIDLYPNPSTGIFYLKLPQDLQIAIYNNLGQLLSSEKMLSGSNVINIADKPVGVYFLKANDGNNISTFKIIKN